MSEIAQKSAQHVAYQDYDVRERHTSSAWVGWIGFAGVVMILSGVFQAIEGLVGIFRQAFYVAAHNSSQVLIVNNVHAWGWINLIVGVVVMLAGISLFTGATWARVVAVLLALGSAIVNMLYLPLYPVWSILCIALSVTVIYAVMAHGAELNEY
jgi:hypothetical protein